MRITPTSAPAYPQSAPALPKISKGSDDGANPQPQAKRLKDEKPTRSPKPCTFWAAQGNCPYGTNCRFTHGAFRRASPPKQRVVGDD